MPSASGPVDIEGLRSVIAEVLAALPADAVEVRESRGRVQSYPGRPDLDLDCLQLHIVPRAAGAQEMRIDVFEQHGGVNVFIGNDVIELTAQSTSTKTRPGPS